MECHARVTDRGDHEGMLGESRTPRLLTHKSRFKLSFPVTVTSPGKGWIPLAIFKGGWRIMLFIVTICLLLRMR